jgi:hypothetical protein
MSNCLTSLIIGAIDDFDRVRNLQRLLEVALNEAEPLEGGRESETSLLIASYLSLSKPYFEEVGCGLERLRELLLGGDSHD